jgi:hypothetical protein
MNLSIDSMISLVQAYIKERKGDSVRIHLGKPESLPALFYAYNYAKSYFDQIEKDKKDGRK